MHLAFSSVLPNTNSSGIKFSGSDDMPSSIDYEQSGKKSGNKYNDDNDTFLPVSKPKKNKKPHFEEGVTTKQKAGYIAEKSLRGLFALGLAGFGTWCAYDTVQAFSPDTQVQEAYEDVKAESEDLNIVQGEALKVTQLQEYFEEIYNNLYLNGEINIAQLTEINQQLDNLDNTNLTPEQRTQLNVLMEASEGVEDINEMKALNEAFLDIYIQDADQREALLNSTSEMLDDGYNDVRVRTTLSKIGNPLLTVLYAGWTVEQLVKIQEMKKPKPEED